MVVPSESGALPETTAASSTSAANTTPLAPPTYIDRSTLTLLEHINLNVPNHDYILPFYVTILGLGLDPRKAQNLIQGKGTVWVNCGASQFHLPYGEQPQVIPGSIGLRYASLKGLKERLETVTKEQHDNKCFASYELGGQGTQHEYVKIEDCYGNVFFCREGSRKEYDAWRQPLVSKVDTEAFGEIATQYGTEESECLGIDYVEFKCPIGTASKIAVFYDSVFDATTTVVEDKQQQVALVAFGNVDEVGRADQNLLFRETDDPIPRYDGHHIALYVGQDARDFAQAFKNSETAGIVWVNPRFSDKASDLEGAIHWHQYRLKDVLDMNTGNAIFELEHEVRSVTHTAWPKRHEP